MPRHQDNVDIILVGNVRPQRVLSGDFALDAPVQYQQPAWWGSKAGNQVLLRTFRAQVRGSELYVFVEVACAEFIHTRVDPAFGDLKRMAVGDPKMSVFKWRSTANHSVTLSIGAERDGVSVPIKCEDPSPTDPLWEFRIGEETVPPKFTTDFSATLLDPKSAKIASFSATYPR